MRSPFPTADEHLHKGHSALVTAEKEQFPKRQNNTAQITEVLPLMERGCRKPGK